VRSKSRQPPRRRTPQRPRRKHRSCVCGSRRWRRRATRRSARRGRRVWRRRARWRRWRRNAGASRPSATRPWLSWRRVGSASATPWTRATKRRTSARTK